MIGGEHPAAQNALSRRPAADDDANLLRRPILRLLLALVAGGGVAALVFFALPFMQVVAGLGQKKLMVRQVAVAQPPPPPPAMEEPPPPDEPEPEEQPQMEEMAQPLSLAVILLVLGLLLSLLRWRKTAWTMAFLGTAIITVCAFTNLGYVVIQGLENRFPRPAVAPAEVAGIIVLGGGMDTDVNNSRRGYELNRSGDRFLETLRLAEIYPQAKVIMTGGGSLLSPGDEREAAAAVCVEDDSLQIDLRAAARIAVDGVELADRGQCLVGPVAAGCLRREPDSVREQDGVRGDLIDRDVDCAESFEVASHAPDTAGL